MLLTRHAKVYDREVCALLAAAGWQGVDMRDICDPDLFLRSEQEVMAYLRQAMDNAMAEGLAVEQCHAPMPRCYQGISSSELEQQISIIEQSVSVAGKLGIPYTVVHPLVYNWSTPDPSSNQTLELNVEYLQRLCHRAEGTVICLENMPGDYGFIRTGEDMKRVLDAVGYDDLMVCLDTGHLIWHGDRVRDFFKVVGERIKVTHIHDALPRYDAHLLAGTGMGDWEDFKSAIQEFGYNGNMNSESRFMDYTPTQLRLQGQILERQILAELTVK